MSSEGKTANFEMCEVNALLVGNTSFCGLQTQTHTHTHRERVWDKINGKHGVVSYIMILAYPTPGAMRGLGSRRLEKMDMI